MARKTTKELKKAFDAGLAERMNWEGTWRDAYRFVLPQRDILDQPQKGQTKGDLVFDSTAIWSAQKLTNRIQSDLFPPFQEFVKFEPGPAVPPQLEDQARALLEPIQDAFHAAIQRSNFDTAIAEFLLEFIIGTGCMLVNEGPDFDPLQFDPAPTPHMILMPGPRGTVGGNFRQWKVPVNLIIPTWPDAKLPSELTEKLKSDPFADVDLVEATYTDYELGIWYYELLWPGGTGSGEFTALMEKPRVFQEDPWIIARWAKAANETFGRGPVLFTLPDIRTANKVVELELKNAALSIAGVYTGVDDGIFNPATAAIRPGNVIPVARNDGPTGPTLQALQSSADFNLGRLVLEDMRDQIRQGLFNKNLPDATGAVRSPTEIIERIREFQVDTGGAFGRIMRELVTPLALRSLNILNRKGIINFPFQIDGQSIKITVTSPLAQQQNLDKLDAFVNWLEINMQLGPELVAFGMKIEDVPAWTGRQLGVPEELIRTDADRTQIEETIARMVQGDQQAAANGAAPPPAATNGAAAPA